MSLWVLKVLMVFYIVLMISTWVEGQPKWTLYWVGAFILTVAVAMNMVKP